ncbi:hypothetical protein BGW80DRAFT_1381090 [Lactifluus volemus]|nr:hypothetical protein BGW80DRAFT_1381090 [Lactifluus volemus]
MRIREIHLIVFKLKYSSLWWLARISSGHGSPVIPNVTTSFTSPFPESHKRPPCFFLLIYEAQISPNPPTANHISPPLNNFQMTDGPSQNVGNYPFERVVPSNAVPPVPCNHPAVYRDCTIPAMSDTNRDHIFLTPPATYAPYGASRPVYPHYYERPPANDGTTHIPYATSPMPSNDVVPSHPGGLPHVAAYDPPSLNVQFNGVSENAPETSERSARGATQDFNITDYDYIFPGILMTSVYRDLAIRFIHSPQSNIVMMHMASLGVNSGRCKVTIELDIVDAANA